MLGWLRPLRTSISPQTLSSFPFTFRFEMTLSATSIVTPLGRSGSLGAGEPERDETMIGMHLIVVGGC